MVIKHHCEDFRSYPASVTPVTSQCHKNVTFFKNGRNSPKTWESIVIEPSSMPTKFGDNWTRNQCTPMIVKYHDSGILESNISN